MLFYFPDHGMAYLGSIDAHGKKQTARSLKDWMLNGLAQMSISQNVITSVITDGAAKCKAMQRKLQEKMPYAQSIVCVAHSLDLLLKEMSTIAPFKRILRKVEAIMVFIKSHQSTLKAVRDVGAQAGKSIEPSLPCVTRFASYVTMARKFVDSEAMYASTVGTWEVQQWALEKDRYGTIGGNAVSEREDYAQLTESDSELEMDTESADEEQSDDENAECEEESATDTKAIRKEMHFNEKRRWVQQACDADDEVQAAKIFLAVAEPVSTLLRKVDSGQAFVGKIFHQMYSAQEKINHARRDGIVSDDLCEQVLQVFHKRWDYLHRPVMSVGYMLDPEFIDVNPYAMSTVQKGFDVVASSVLDSKTDVSANKKQEALRQYQMEYKKLARTELAGGGGGERLAQSMPAHEW